MISCKYPRVGLVCLFFSASQVPGLVPGIWWRKPTCLFNHIYYSLHQLPSQHILCHLLLSYFFLCVSDSSHPVLSGVEQPDLDLNPCSKIVPLLPASFLPEYGQCIVLIGNCKFQQPLWNNYLAYDSLFAFVPILVQFLKANEVLPLILYLWACCPCLKCP